MLIEMIVHILRLKINLSRRFLFVLTINLLFGYSLTAQADSIDSGSVHQNTKLLDVPNYAEEIEETDETFSLPKIDTSPLISDSVTDATLHLIQVEFSGNTVFDDAELQVLAAPFIGKPVNANDLEQLSFIVSKHYNEAGYVNSGAILPEQDLLDGVLQIQIIEGKLTDIKVTGNGWLHPDYVRGRLQNNQVLNVNSLQEHYLMLINDPVIDKLNGSLKPTGTLGESQLDVEVTRARPFGMSVQGNNYRAPSIGAEQFIVNSWVRNLTRWGDTVDFSYGLSSGSDTYAGGISLPLNSAGSLFSFRFNLGNTSVIEEPLNSVDIRSKVENFSWTLSHPFYKSLDHTVVMGASFATRFNQTSLLGEDFSFVRGLTNGKSKVSVARIFQEYLGRFERHVFALRSTVNVGINSFNSTIQDNHNLPDSQYLSWLGQSQYAFKVLDNGAQFKARGTAQLTNDTLLAQERLSVGGVRTVRGYRQNELVRDQGYVGGIEFHYPIIGEVGGNDNKLVLIPFMDYGAAWNKGGPTKRLHSVGIGFHWQPIRYIKADFFYGHDISKARKKTEYNLQDSGIHFNLTVTSF